MVRIFKHIEDMIKKKPSMAGLLYALVLLFIIFLLASIFIVLGFGFLNPDQIKKQKLSHLNLHMYRLDKIFKDKPMYNQNFLNDQKQLYINKYNEDISKIHDNMTILETIDIVDKQLKLLILWFLIISIISLFALIIILKYN